jgi:glyoxylase I family protein
MEISGTHHIAVKVADLARAESFYVSVLGLPVSRRWPSADGRQDRSVWLDLGAGAFLALERGEKGPQKSENASGIHLLALRIRRDEREAWASKLAEAGYAVYHQTSFTIYVQDPEGNRIGLSHWPEAWPASEPHR